MYIAPAAQYFDTFINFLDCIEKPDIIHLGLDVHPGFKGIVYNTEQLTIPRVLTKILKLALVPGLEFWDYSMVNIRIMANHGIVVKYMPLKTTGPYLEKLKMFADCKKVYDIGFNGSISPRRKVILDQLATSFTVLTSTHWGDKRDMELAQCRVIVNIHFGTDYMIFESARCEPWLAIGVPVISELSIENDERCILTTYDGFLDTVKKYFQNKNQSLGPV
jgi:hypothetical protein